MELLMCVVFLIVAMMGGIVRKIDNEQKTMNKKEDENENT